MRKISELGEQLIARFEGCRLDAYQDAVGVWTIGYGHTGYVKFFEKTVCTGMKITQEQAVELLKEDLSKFESLVNQYNSIYHWNQNEFDALVSFAMNVGNISGLTASGTRSKDTIAEKILLYNKAGGQTLAGLVTRRKAERELFLKKVPSAVIKSATIKNISSNSIFRIKVMADSLRIRLGPGVNYKQTGSIKDKGVYTITKEQDNWGYLKSGVGWICLDHTKKL